MIKKPLNRLAISLFTALFILTGTGCQKLNVSNAPVKDVSIPIRTEEKATDKPSNLSNYNINAVLYADKNLLEGVQKIDYINNCNTTLNEIYFHLYPNAYATAETAPVLFDNFSGTFPEGFNPGGTEITTITHNNKKLQYSIGGVDKTILKVPLEKSLKPGERIALELSFKVTIPKATDRFGAYKGVFNLGNWYPIAAVYDETGWNLDPYYKIGDPFYSDVSNYKVSLKLPSNYVIASTGSLVEENKDGDWKTCTYEEKCVRDFAWIASSKFKVDEAQWEGVKIKSFYLPGNEIGRELALKAAVDSIKLFSTVYGKYPYNSYCVVATNFSSGMEYPGLVYINEGYYNSSKLNSLLEYTIVHETAHQWWYSAVGNDEIDEAWLDESFATYSEAVFYEKRDNFKGYITNIENRFEAQKGQLRGNEVILRPVNNFQNWSDYGPLVYRKGAIMLNKLRIEVGDEVFFKILTTYFDSYKFKNAKTKDFIKVVEDTTKKDWSAFFKTWLQAQ